jgi:hypothetical protein
MKIISELVQKLIITDVENFDPICVYLEDQGIGKGKIIITCHDKCWSSLWGAMGNKSLSQFILHCDNDYLIGKLSDIQEYVPDYGSLSKECKKTVCVRRRCKEFRENEAREMFDAIDNEELENDYDLLFKIYSDEWSYNIPQMKNHEWEYQSRILDVIKEALKELDKKNENF